MTIKAKWLLAPRVWLYSALSLLSACGGGGGSGSGSPQPVASPTVSLTASASDVAINGSVTLEWTSTNASTCTPSSGWSASGVSGSQSVLVAQTTTYSISCSGPGGMGDSGNVTVTAWGIPNATISSDATNVLPNSSVSLSWASQNAQSCTGGDALFGILPTSGSQSSNPITSTIVFSVTCSNPIFVGSKQSVTVTVSAALTLAITVQYQSPGPPVMPTGYSLTDIGLLPGGNYSFGTAINNSGTVIGYGGTGTNTQSAFIWKNGVMSDFSTLAGGVAGGGIIQGINSFGEIVGIGPNGAFSWMNGVRSDLGFFPSSGASSTATAVNDSGQIVGWGYAGPGSYHAWRWQNNAFTDLGTLGGPQSQAAAINSSGVIVGGAQPDPSTQHAFSWISGVMTDLSLALPDPTSSSAATSINDSNVVVGIVQNSLSGSQKAAIWSAGAPTILPTFAGATPQYGAQSVNNAGIIVGYALNANSAQRAVAWVGGQIGDLNSQVLVSDPLKPFVTLTNAVGINVSGQILANGSDSRLCGGNACPIGSMTHSYVLTPTLGQYFVPDWAHPVVKPVPFVWVELQNSSGTVVQHVFTDANGTAVFSGLDPTMTYTPVVRAKVVQAPLGLDFVVMNNTNPIDATQPTFRGRYAPYALSAANYTPGLKKASQSLVLTAQDGWDSSDGVLVDSNRLSGPLTLLANAVAEAQIISAAVGGNSITWRPLTILWSIRNKGGLASPPNNYDLGIATGSGGFYAGGHGAITASGTDSGAAVSEDFIYVSGDPTFEAMEIYPFVMTHEMGHFSQTQFSTRVAPGSDHAYTDYEDQTQSWIEGNASGIAALVMNTPRQDRVFSANGQPIVDSYNVDTDSNETGPENNPLGWFQETTVTRLLWRVYDPQGALKMSSAVSLAPMFTPSWKTGPWLNTAWAYVEQLKKLNPTSASSIDSIAESLNISSIGDDEWGTIDNHPGNIAAQYALPPYTVVPISSTPTTICSTGAPLDYNKEGNTRYIRATGDGNVHTLTVVGPTGSVPILNRRLYTAGSSSLTVSGTLPVGDTVLTVGDCGVTLGEFSSQTTACNEPAPPANQCWSITIQ